MAMEMKDLLAMLTEMVNNKPALLPRSDMTYAEARELLLAEIPTATLEFREDLEYGTAGWAVWNGRTGTDRIRTESKSLAGAVNATLAEQRAKTAEPDTLTVDQVMESAYEPLPL